MSDIEQKLIAAGGKLWETGGHRRIYFNPLELLHADVTRYKTGSFSHVMIDGETISNGDARRLYYSKVYWDCVRGGAVIRAPMQYAEQLAEAIVTLTE